MLINARPTAAPAFVPIRCYTDATWQQNVGPIDRHRIRTLLISTSSSTTTMAARIWWSLCHDVWMRVCVLARENEKKPWSEWLETWHSSSPRKPIDFGFKRSMVRDTASFRTFGNPFISVKRMQLQSSNFVHHGRLLCADQKKICRMRHLYCRIQFPERNSPPQIYLYLHCPLSLAAQCIVISPVCLRECLCVCLRVCYHDNSKLRASIFTKLDL